jgi:rhodanese-related sulfurtransferase
VIRRLLRNLADRAFVGRRPDFARAPAQEPNRWTTSPPPPVDPEAAEGGADLEVEAPIPGSLLLDIREPGELASGVAAGAMLLPMDLVPHHLDRLPRDRPITVYCAAGARSWGVAHWLREQGFPEAWSLSGGIGAVGQVEMPPGNPGRSVDLPAAESEGAWMPAQTGEVIEWTSHGLRCRARDSHGFWVERLLPEPTRGRHG